MDSKNQAETLSEKVDAITRQPVATAISNIQSEYLGTSKRLLRLSIQECGTVLNMLNTEFQLRQETAKAAVDEYKHKEMLRQAKEADENAKKLAAEQKDIEDANRPKLAQMPGVQKPQ